MELAIARVEVGVCPLRLVQSDREEESRYKHLVVTVANRRGLCQPDSCLESEVVDASMSRSHVTLYRVSA